MRQEIDKYNIGNVKSFDDGTYNIRWDKEKEGEFIMSEDFEAWKKQKRVEFRKNIEKSIKGSSIVGENAYREGIIKGLKIALLEHDEVYGK